MNPPAETVFNSHPEPDLILTYLVSYFVFFYCIFSGARMVQDPDLLWHIALGRDILKTGNVPFFDTYSWTLSGAPYVSKDWLSELLLAFVYAQGGFAGLVFLGSLSIVLTFALLSYEISKKLPLLITLGLCLISLLLLSPHLLCRPHLLVLPLVIIWSGGLLKSAEEGTPPKLVLIPFLFLWSQMHGSFILGIGLIPFFFYESISRITPLTFSKLLPYGIFLIVSLLVPFLGPYGFEILKGLFNQLSLQETLYFITEWQPQDFGRLTLFQVIMLGAIGGALYSGFSLPAARILLLIILLHMALTHIRHVDFLALLAPLVLANPLSSQLQHKKKSNLALAGNPKRLMGVSLVLALLVTGFIFFTTPFSPPPSVMPAVALKELMKYEKNERGLNSYDFGGYLIFSGHKTYIDGRQDFYGPDFVTSYAQLINLSDAAELKNKLDEMNITWSLVKPSEKVEKSFNQLRDWVKIFEDTHSVLYIRSEHLSVH